MRNIMKQTYIRPTSLALTLFTENNLAGAISVGSSKTDAINDESQFLSGQKDDPFGDNDTWDDME